MKQLEAKFDYNSVTPQIAEFLKSKEIEMSNIIGKAYTEIGQELKEVQDELSKNGYGCFEEWYTNLGFKKDQVYRWIGRYELILANCDKRELIEELPISLSYETSKPSVIPELKQQVLDGEITSLKQFKDLEKQLKETERERVRLENESVHYRQLLNQERSKPSQVVTKEIKVEVVPERLTKELEQLKFDNVNLKHGFQSTKEKLKQYELINTVDFDAEQSRKQREKMQHEADFNTLELRVHITNFLEKAAISSFMQGAITASDPITKRKLQESISMLESFTTQIKAALNGRILGGIVNE